MVYVDDMRAGFISPRGTRRMTMCHMVADSTNELLAMVDTIGVQRKWIQKAGTAREHFDICLEKRALAVAAGAIEINERETSAMCFRREIEGKLGDPGDAIDWRWAYRRAKAKDATPQGRDGEPPPATA